MGAYDLTTHLGAYLYELNHFQPNGLVGFFVTEGKPKALRGFADASGKERTPGETIITVNGCLSTPDLWSQFDNEWQPYLKSEGFYPDKDFPDRYVFHASTFWKGTCKYMPESLRGLEDDRKLYEKRRIYRHLIELVRTYALFKFGHAVNLLEFSDFENEYPDVRYLVGQPGTFLSRLCFKHNRRWAVENGFRPGIAYRFDRGDDEFWGELYEDYRMRAKKWGEDEDAHFITELLPGNKAEYSPIQAADIIAWECGRYFRRLTPTELEGTDQPPPPGEFLKLLSEEGKSDYTVYNREHMRVDLRSRFYRILEAIGRRDAVGGGGLLKDIDEYARGILNTHSELRANHDERLKEKWRKRGEAKKREKDDGT